MLRIIAIDRAIHFSCSPGLAVLIFAFASHRAQLQKFVNRLDTAFYGSSERQEPARPRRPARPRAARDAERLDPAPDRLRRCCLRAARGRRGGRPLVPEAVGRVPDADRDGALPAVRDLRADEDDQHAEGARARRSTSRSCSTCCLAKRLFGLRGGAAAEHAARERDSGWDAFQKLTPGEWVAAEES